MSVQPVVREGMGNGLVRAIGRSDIVGRVLVKERLHVPVAV